MALNFIRIKLFTIPGLSSPAPFGGKQRQIMIYVDPAKLSAQGASPAERLERAAEFQRDRAGRHRAHRRP